MGSRDGRRRGFTLVEVVVGLSVFAVILYVVYDMFVGGIRAFRREEGKTQSMEGAILAYEMLAHDLRQQIYFGWNGAEVAATQPVEIIDDGHGLRFKRCTGMAVPPDGLPSVGFEDVEYRLAPGELPDFKYLSRNGDVRHGVRLLDMTFEIKQAVRTDGKPLTFVAMRLWGYGEQERDHNLLLGLVALDAYSQRSVQPYWVQNARFLTGGTARPPF